MTWFKQLRLATQLVTAFIVVALIAVAIGLVKYSALRHHQPAPRPTLWTKFRDLIRHLMASVR